MNVFSVVDCLKQDGSLTTGEAHDFNGIIKSVSGLQTRDILALLFALQLVKSGNANDFDQSVIGVQSILSTDTVDIKSLTVPAGATSALITIAGNNIIYRLDGGNPSSPSTGNYGALNTVLRVTDLANFKFISTSTTDAILYVNYF